MAKGNSRAIRAARAFVEIFADDSKLVSGLRRAQARLRNFGASVRRIGLGVAAIGAAMMAPLIAATRTFANVGDDMAKMAQRTGVSVSALSALRFAAQQSGTSIGSLERSLRRMARTVGYAQQGLTTGTRALEQLDLTLADIVDLQPEEQFRLFADRISKVENATLKAAIAMEVFGRAGSELLPLIEQGADGIDKLMQEAQRLGLIVSPEDAKNAVMLTDAFGRLRMAMQMTAFRIGAALAPIFTKLYDSIARVSGVISDFIKNNTGLIIFVAKLAAALIAGGIAIVAIGTSIMLVAKAVGILLIVSKVLFAVFSGMLAVITAMTSPLGLVAVAIAGIAFQLLRGTNGVKRAVNRFGKLFNDLRDDVSQVFSDISERIQQGDIEGAAKVAFYGIKLVWANVWHGIEELFEGVVNRLAEDWFALTNVMANVWIWLKSTIGRIMQEISAAAQTAWVLVQDFIAQRMIEIWGTFDATIDVEGTKKQLEALKNAELSNIENTRKADKKANEDSYNEQKAQNDALLAERLEQLRQIHSDETKEIEERLAAAKEEYELAVEAIRERKKALEEEQKKIKDGLSEFLDITRSFGTFSVFNNLALQGMEPDSELVKLARDIEKNTRQENGDDVFP